MGSGPFLWVRIMPLSRGAPVLPRGRRVHHLAVLGQLVRRGEAKAEVLEQAIGKYRLDVLVSEALISG